MDRLPIADLHCHILPGLDDGPAELSRALDLADAAASADTRIIAATPHLRDDHASVDVHELAERCDELNRSIRDAAIPIRVVPAAEVDLIWAIEASPDDLRLASYGQAGTHLLLETPLDMLPPNFEKLVLKVQARGYRVVLAHPERNRGFQRNPERLFALPAQSVLLQVNSGSVTGLDRGEHARDLARVLLRRNLVHLIASDAHSAGPRRPPGLQEALSIAARLRGAPSDHLCRDAPAAVLNGEDPADSGVAVPQERRWRGLRPRRAHLSAS